MVSGLNNQLLDKIYIPTWIYRKYQIVLQTQFEEMCLEVHL